MLLQKIVNVAEVVFFCESTLLMMEAAEGEERLLEKFDFLELLQIGLKKDG